MMAHALLCIDVGYTHTRFATWTGSELLDMRRILTPKTWALGDGEARRRAWLAHLLSEVDAERVRRPELARIGICFPGVVTRRGDIWRENTIWGYTRDDLVPEALEAALGLPVFVLNDMTAAAVRYGRDDGIACERHLLVVSVSSGIGAKMYDRQLEEVVLEPRGRNGEIGLAIVDDSPTALVNPLGLKGILGNTASGFSFAWMLRLLAQEEPALFAESALRARIDQAGTTLEEMERVTLNDIGMQSVREGDAFCLRAVSASARQLARVLHTLILFAAPDRIVITGGFANTLGERYLSALQEHLVSLFQILYTAEEIRQLVLPGSRDDLDNLMGVAAWGDTPAVRAGADAFGGRPG